VPELRDLSRESRASVAGDDRIAHVDIAQRHHQEGVGAPQRNFDNPR
jgi:hypothetical protein